MASNNDTTPPTVDAPPSGDAAVATPASDATAATPGQTASDNAVNLAPVAPATGNEGDLSNVREDVADVTSANGTPAESPAESPADNAEVPAAVENPEIAAVDANLPVAAGEATTGNAANPTPPSGDAGAAASFDPYAPANEGEALLNDAPGDVAAESENYPEINLEDRADVGTAVSFAATPSHSSDHGGSDGDAGAEDLHKLTPKSNRTNATSKLDLSYDGYDEESGKEHAAAAAAAAAAAGSSSCTKRRWTIAAVLVVLLVTAVVLGIALSGKVEQLYISNPFFSAAPDGTDMPPGQPSAAPTDVPSSSPTQRGSPSAKPSVAPSDVPSSSPSASPSDSPSASPTAYPTMAPTALVIPQHPIPRNPPRGYFNYDPNSDFGPQHWGNVDTSESFMKEFSNEGFGAWQGHFGDATRNLCFNIASQQSPRDLGDGTMPCEATHMIRTRCGDLGVSRPELEKQILPHKLSIRLTRRPCLDVVEGDSWRCRGKEKPPTADYPMYTFNKTAYSDMFNWDIKVPSEHTIRGERFDAEIQMFHGYPSEPRRSLIGLPVRATPDGYNLEFQHILDQFRFQYMRNMARCKRNRQRNRNLRNNAAAKMFEEELAFIEAGGEGANIDNVTYYEDMDVQRRLFRGKFNPYSEALLPGIYFHRYRGSLTEPPCTVVTWFVMHKPLIISTEQLSMIKRIMFTNVDENCNPTSVHNNDMSVARPQFGDNANVEGGIQDCFEGEFQTDIEQGRPHGIECRNQF